MSKLEKSAINENARLTVYAIMIICVILHFILPFKYACNSTDIICPMCGLKTAIWYSIHFDFASAFDSNKLIVLVGIFYIVFIIDTVYISLKRILHIFRNKEHLREDTHNENHF